jgi:hypothetical protein
MLTCQRCDTPETLEAPFIDGVCCDCLRRENDALAGILGSRSAAAIVSAPAPTSNWKRSLKLHMRDFFWLTLLLAISMKAYLIHRQHQAAAARVKILSANLTLSELKRSENDLDWNNYKSMEAAFYRARDQEKASRERVQVLDKQLDSAERALDEALRREELVQSEFDRLKIREYWKFGKLELLVPSYLHRYPTRDTPETSESEFFPTD